MKCELCESHGRFFITLDPRTKKESALITQFAIAENNRRLDAKARFYDDGICEIAFTSRKKKSGSSTL